MTDRSAEGDAALEAAGNAGVRGTAKGPASGDCLRAVILPWRWQIAPLVAAPQGVAGRGGWHLGLAADDNGGMNDSVDIPGQMRRSGARLTYVVGHSRGGTTWLGELLACHGEVRYVFEPFASQAHPCTGIDMQTVFNGGRFIHPAKRGSRVPDLPVPRFFRGPDDPGAVPLARLAAQHLHEVVRRAHPDADGRHVVVKQPRIENVAWAAAAIQADTVVVLDRHPFGVVNSVWRWRMLNWTNIDRALIAADDTLPPDIKAMFAAAATREERLLVLSWLRSRHARGFIASRADSLLVDYEQLCLDPVGETRRVWRHIGLPMDATADARLATLVATRASGGDKLARFFNVHQDPLTRQHAWRHELPDSLRRRLERFVRRHGLDIPLPGAGLPGLTRGERLRAQANDLRAAGSRCRIAADVLRYQIRGRAA
jgi:hypothetical protein